VAGREAVPDGNQRTIRSGRRRSRQCGHGCARPRHTHRRRGRRSTPGPRMT